ncbi:unnamed protein product, partial [Vitis vinifera]|uniref:Uncharacterized protein n=1 Tax=Vitis vinifera TaxID=29760 RepID=E0CP06_VITVI
MHIKVPLALEHLGIQFRCTKQIQSYNSSLFKISLAGALQILTASSRFCYTCNGVLRFWLEFRNRGQMFF